MHIDIGVSGVTVVILLKCVLHQCGYHYKCNLLVWLHNSVTTEGV